MCYKKFQMARTSQRAEHILDGFKFHWMNLRDADSGKVLWQSSDDLYEYYFIFHIIT